MRTGRASVLGRLLLMALVVTGCVGGPVAYQFRSDIFFKSLFAPDNAIIHGLLLTVSIAVVSQVIGVVLGIFAALGRLSRRRPARWAASFYIWIFRGTPLLVQLVIVVYGLPNAHIFKWNELDLGGFVIDGAVLGGIFTLGVNEGAYMAEIVRAGIIAVDAGQLEAAKSLGMTYGMAMRRIVLPQAARVIVPPLGNEFNNMLKTTSLLVLISVQELFVTFEIKNGNGPSSFHPFELFLACAVWFLLLTTIWGVIQGWIERRLARGVPGAPVAGPGLRERLLGVRTTKPDVTPLPSGR
jgi:polar amino acid transport system permease protein